MSGRSCPRTTGWRRLIAAGWSCSTTTGPISCGGRAYQWAVPLLDGKRTVTYVVSELHGEVFSAEVFYALNVLVGKGLVVEGPLLAPVPEGRSGMHKVSADRSPVAVCPPPGSG